MKAKVFFASMRADLRMNLLDKVAILLAKCGLGEAFTDKHLVAIKTHFGEAGNTAFVRPVFMRQVVQAAKQTGAEVFVTDTGTLYRGSRGNAVRHLETAHHHGFTYGTLGAPVVIADGLRCRAGVRVPINGEHYKEVEIGEALARADGMIVVSHFKLHEATGFGGAIKNIGMGGATRTGKLSMHSSVSPVVDTKKCDGDGICVRACTFNAISLVDGVAVINEKICTGCAECLGVCPQNAISIRWNMGTDILQERMAEHALGAVHGKAGKCFYISFIMTVSPACDCYGMNDAPIVPDIGIMASTDPVALDAACLDAIQKAPGNHGSRLKQAFEPGSDKIADVYPAVRYTKQLQHAEKIGLGVRDYEMIPIDQS